MFSGITSDSSSGLTAHEAKTIVHISPSQRALLQAAYVAHLSGPKCPNCQELYVTGTRECGKCGHQSDMADQTMLLSAPVQYTPAKTGLLGEPSIDDRKPITLEIDKSSILVPILDNVVVGRMSTSPGDPIPDIDLNPFSAHTHGVSRRHIKIVRVRNWPYVIDLGSSNGTFLNGRALIPHNQRVLRNGDELQLGRLKLRVKF
jgi:hypothetical protein